MTKATKKTVVTILLLCVAISFACFAACGGSSGTVNGSNSGSNSSNVNGNNSVSNSNVVVTSISLNRSSVTLEIGDTVSLYETITPSNATNKSVTWSSSNTSVATVSSGTVTAKSAGSATITAKSSNGKTATCSVTVKKAESQTVAVTSVTLNKTSETVEVGKTLSLTAMITPSNATDKSVSWSSSNTSVASVSNGTVTAKSAGSATITAKTSNGKTATCSITVKKAESQTVAVTSVTLNKTSETLEVGKTLSLTATINPSNATDKSVSWSSSNTSVASVSNGTVTAKSAGSATITAKSSNGKTATCSVTVVNASVLPTSLYLSKSYVSLEEGSTTTITTTFLPSNTTNKTLEWVVLDTSVATVENGTITAVGEGDTTLIVTTTNGLTAKCIIYVTSPFSFRSSGSGYSLTAYNGNATEIVVPSTYKGKKVISIGAECFADCVDLVSITLPNTILEIYYWAFSNCTGLTNITIPDSVTNIGSGVFRKCSSLEEITIPFVGDAVERTSTDTVQYSFGYIFGTDSYVGGTATKQCYYNYYPRTTCDTYYLPSSLRKVTVTGGNILYGAFNNCSMLTSITIPNSVTSIGESVFSGCSTLTSIIVAENNTNYKSIDGNLYSKDGKTLIQYAIGKKNTSFTISDSVTSIGDYAFYECRSLTEIKYNATECADLSFGNMAFYNAGKDGTGIKVAIGKNVKKVPAYLFKSVSYITEVVFEKDSKCESIGDSAFKGCESLQSMTLPFIGANKNKSGEIYERVFGYIFGYTITAEYIAGTIYQCSKDGHSCLFYIPSSLKSVTIMGENIPLDAFYNCKMLMSVTIGDNVTSIDSCAFYGCSSLTSVTIPKSVTDMGNGVFSNCCSMTKIYCEATSEPLGWARDWNCVNIYDSDRSYYSSSVIIWDYKNK